MTFSPAPDFTDGILTAAKLQQVSDAINTAYPWGRIIARGKRTSNATATSGTTEQGVLRLDSVALTSGNLYYIWCPVLVIDTSVAADVARCVLRYSTSGSATTSDTVLHAGNVVLSDASNAEAMTLGATYAPSTDETFSVLLSYLRTSGTGVQTMVAGATVPIELLVVDCGEDPTDSGVDI